MRIIEAIGGAVNPPGAWAFSRRLCRKKHWIERGPVAG